MVKKFPTHVAIIMDGNSRWAKMNNLPKKRGYKKGIKTLENLIDICIKIKIKILTVYALSTENIYRKDINILYTLISDFIKNSKKDHHKFDNIDFRLIGDRNNINKDILSFFEKIEKNKKSKKKIILNFAYNYGSWKELEFCIKKIVSDHKNNNKDINLINENYIKNNLYTNDIPDPDLLIRTGGNKRLSNFLLLQLRYAEVFFIDTLWPDFNETNFIDILDQFNKRKRTFGL